MIRAWLYNEVSLKLKVSVEVGSANLETDIQRLFLFCSAVNGEIPCAVCFLMGRES